MLLVILAFGVWIWFGTTAHAPLSSSSLDAGRSGGPPSCSVPQLAIASGRPQAERSLQEPVLPDKSTDLEWRDLPLSRNDLIAEIVAIPQYTRASKLLRNATFNPRDLYLPLQARRDIEAVIAGALPPIKVMLQEFQQVCDREWQDLHAEGATIVVNIGEQGSVTQLQKIGRDPMFRIEEGVTYGVTKARMPETRTAELRLKQAGVDLCRDLATAFGARGALTPDEETAAIARSRKNAGLQAESR